MSDTLIDVGLWLTKWVTLPILAVVLLVSLLAHKWGIRGK